MTKISLYEYEPTRSARPRWAVLEAGIEYESIGNDASVFGHPDLGSVHPLRKIPAAIIDGKPLFESAAITAAIADLVPEKNLIAKPGTWDRSLHDQWVLFVLTEMEAWFWPNFLNMVILPDEQKNLACIDQNIAMFKRGAAALDKILGEQDYLVGGQFSVTDIIASYSVNGARKFGYIEDFPNLQKYLERMFKREHCTLDQS
jgi:glutathione S-transferase